MSPDKILGVGDSVIKKIGKILCCRGDCWAIENMRH